MIHCKLQVNQMLSQSLGQMLIDFKADNWLKNNLKLWRVKQPLQNYTNSCQNNHPQGWEGWEEVLAFVRAFHTLTNLSLIPTK